MHLLETLRIIMAHSHCTSADLLLPPPGEEVEVDMEKDVLTNLTTGKTYPLKPIGEVRHWHADGCCCRCCCCADAPHAVLLISVHWHAAAAATTYLASCLSAAPALPGPQHSE